MAKIDNVETTLKKQKEITEAGLKRTAIFRNFVKNAVSYTKSGVEMDEEFKSNFVAFFGQEMLNDDLYAISIIHEMMLKLKERGLVDYDVVLG